MMLIIMNIVVELEDFKGFWGKNVKGIMRSKCFRGLEKLVRNYQPAGRY